MKVLVSGRPSGGEAQMIKLLLNWRRTQTKHAEMTVRSFMIKGFVWIWTRAGIVQLSLTSLNRHGIRKHFLPSVCLQF